MPTTSVQLYSLRDAVQSDLAATLQRLADLGLQHVEPYAFHLRTEDYRRALADSGLTAPSGHAAVIDSDNPEPIMQAAVELGIKTLIDPYIPSERWQTESDAIRLASRVNNLRDLAADHGLDFGYHNHFWELANTVGGNPILDTFVAHLDLEVVLEIDTYWATVGGVDTPALLRDLGERVRFIHVKDGTRDGDLNKQVPAGQGEIDVVGVLAAAPAAVRVIEFDSYPGDVFKAVEASFHWLQEHDRAISTH